MAARKKRSIRLSDKEWALLHELAKKEGLFVSEYIRFNLLHGLDFSSSSVTDINLKTLEEKIEGISRKIDRIEELLISLPSKFFVSRREEEKGRFVNSLGLYYSDRIDELLRVKSVSELEAIVPYEHWRRYVVAFLDVLRRSGAVFVNPRGVLVWDDEKLREVMFSWKKSKF